MRKFAVGFREEPAATSRPPCHLTQDRAISAKLNCLSTPRNKAPATPLGSFTNNDLGRHWAHARIWARVSPLRPPFPGRLSCKDLNSH